MTLVCYSLIRSKNNETIRGEGDFNLCSEKLYFPVQGQVAAPRYTVI